MSNLQHHYSNASIRHIHKEARNEGGSAHSEYQIAIECAKQGYHSQSLLHMQKALEHSRACENTELEGKICRSIAVIYCDLKQPQKSVSFAMRGLEIAKITENKSSEGKALLALGVAYQQQGYMERAKRAFENVLDIAIAEENKKLEGVASENLAQVLTLMGKYNKSIALHKKAIGIAETHGDTAGYRVAQKQIDLTLKQHEKFTEALEFSRMRL